MPTPTKVLWFTNVNLLNNAKYAYDMLKNVNPKIDMIVSQDIEMTASCEYADVVLPANSWVEFQDVEVTASCSNPFLQIWKGGIKPVVRHAGRLRILAGVAQARATETGDQRFARLLEVRARGQARGLPPAPARDVRDDERATRSRTSWPASTASPARR